MTTTTEEKTPAAETSAAVAPPASEKHADKRKALGRGLDSLLPSSLPRRDHAEPHEGVVAEIHAQAARPTAGEAVVQIPLDHIDPNPYQTRVEFDEEALADLRASIQASGVLSPIVVRPGKEGRYVLVLGERRCRASKMAGKATIPAIVRRVSDQIAAEMTVVENLQRQDLNCMEQAARLASALDCRANRLPITCGC